MTFLETEFDPLGDGKSKLKLIKFFGGDLIGYENRAYHKVDHINPELRVTFVDYERDKTLEEKIKVKVEAARKYYDEVVALIAKQHEVDEETIDMVSNGRTVIKRFHWRKAQKVALLMKSIYNGLGHALQDQYKR